MRDAGDANPSGTLLAESANYRVVNNDHSCSSDYFPPVLRIPGSIFCYQRERLLVASPHCISHRRNSCHAQLPYRVSASVNITHGVDIS